MKEKTTVADKGRHPSRHNDFEQPLIKALMAHAHRRGESLAQLAKHLGVTYERLSQWRRNPSKVATANETVFVNAAKYLGVPTILAMGMANRIELCQFVWPDAATLDDRVFQQLDELRQDRFLGGFVPRELADTPLPVQLFVVFLYHQLGRPGTPDDSGHRWLNTLQQAAVGEEPQRVQSGKVPHSTAGDGAIF
jgi:transcriptional regulator with XRE-family HTH domain